MNVELWGGPHDGQTMTVPAHLLYVRVPVPGTAHVVSRPSFEEPEVPLVSGFWVATYERWSFTQTKTVFKYAGQEHTTA